MSDPRWEPLQLPPVTETFQSDYEQLRDQVIASLGIPKHLLGEPMTESGWLVSDDPMAMIQFLRAGITTDHAERHARLNDRKLRLFACACCRAVWPLLMDARSRQAVEVAERYADGLATQKEMDRAWSQANAPDRSPAVIIANHVAIDGPCDVWIRDVPREMIEAGLNHVWQANLLREIVGNPFRRDKDQYWPFHKRQEYCTPTVRSLAQAAYDERATDGFLEADRLAVLADALEDDGCTDETILRHLRGEEPVIKEDKQAVTVDLAPRYRLIGWRPLRGPHVRGCWVLDLILGKE